MCLSGDFSKNLFLVLFSLYGLPAFLGVWPLLATRSCHSGFCCLHLISSSDPPASLRALWLHWTHMGDPDGRLSPSRDPKFNHICKVPVTVKIKYSQISGTSARTSAESRHSARHGKSHVAVVSPENPTSLTLNYLPTGLVSKCSHLAG